MNDIFQIFYLTCHLAIATGFVCRFCKKSLTRGVLYFGACLKIRTGALSGGQNMGHYVQHVVHHRCEPFLFFAIAFQTIVSKILKNNHRRDDRFSTAPVYLNVKCNLVESQEDH